MSDQDLYKDIQYNLEIKKMNLQDERRRLFIECTVGHTWFWIAIIMMSFLSFATVTVLSHEKSNTIIDCSKADPVKLEEAINNCEKNSFAREYNFCRQNMVNNLCEQKLIEDYGPERRVLNSKSSAADARLVHETDKS